MYLKYGGQDKAYRAEIVAGGDRQWCFKSLEDHGFQGAGSLGLMNKTDRDRLFFDTEQDAIDYDKGRKDEWNASKKKYDDYAEEWKKRREQP